MRSRSSNGPAFRCRREIAHVQRRSGQPWLGGYLRRRRGLWISRLTRVSESDAGLRSANPAASAALRCEKSPDAYPFLLVSPECRRRVSGRVSERSGPYRRTRSRSSSRRRQSSPIARSMLTERNGKPRRNASHRAAAHEQSAGCRRAGPPAQWPRNDGNWDI